MPAQMQVLPDTAKTDSTHIDANTNLLIAKIKEKEPNRQEVLRLLNNADMKKLQEDYRKDSKFQDGWNKFFGNKDNISSAISYRTWGDETGNLIAGIGAGLRNVLPAIEEYFYSEGKEEGLWQKKGIEKNWNVIKNRWQKAQDVSDYLGAGLYTLEGIVIPAKFLSMVGQVGGDIAGMMAEGLVPPIPWKKLSPTYRDMANARDNAMLDISPTTPNAGPTPENIENAARATQMYWFDVALFTIAVVPFLRPIKPAVRAGLAAGVGKQILKALPENIFVDRQVRTEVWALLRAGKKTEATAKLAEAIQKGLERQGMAPTPAAANAQYHASKIVQGIKDPNKIVSFFRGSAVLAGSSLPLDWAVSSWKANRIRHGIRDALDESLETATKAGVDAPVITGLKNATGDYETLLKQGTRGNDPKLIEKANKLLDETVENAGKELGKQRAEASALRFQISELDWSIQNLESKLAHATTQAERQALERQIDDLTLRKAPFEGKLDRLERSIQIQEGLIAKWDYQVDVQRNIYMRWAADRRVGGSSFYKKYEEAAAKQSMDEVNAAVQEIETLIVQGKRKEAGLKIKGVMKRSRARLEEIATRRAASSEEYGIVRGKIAEECKKHGIDAKNLAEEGGDLLPQIRAIRDTKFKEYSKTYGAGKKSVSPEKHFEELDRQIERLNELVDIHWRDRVASAAEAINVGAFLERIWNSSMARLTVSPAARDPLLLTLRPYARLRDSYRIWSNSREVAKGALNSSDHIAAGMAADQASRDAIGVLDEMVRLSETEIRAGVASIPAHSAKSRLRWSELFAGLYTPALYGAAVGISGELLPVALAVMLLNPESTLGKWVLIPIKAVATPGIREALSFPFATAQADETAKSGGMQQEVQTVQELYGPPAPARDTTAAQPAGQESNQKEITELVDKSGIIKFSDLQIMAREEFKKANLDVADNKVLAVLNKELGDIANLIGTGEIKTIEDIRTQLAKDLKTK